MNKYITTFFFISGCLVASATCAEPLSIKTRSGNELGLTFSSYRYEEPSLGVSLTGDKFGANHTGTLLLKNDWFVKDDLHFVYGPVDYVGSGVSLGNPDWYYEVRAMLGRDFQVRSVVLSPYVGLGYRYLFNDARGYSSTGSAGYRRESNYLYLPLGLTHHMEMPDRAVLSTTLEYDYLLLGKQVTRLSDLIGHNGMISAFDTTNPQHSGYGLRLSVMYEMSDWAFGPYLNVWHIDTSEVTTQIMTDTSGSSWVALEEPKNRTTEFGIRTQFRF